MQNVVASDRFCILLMVGQYLPPQMHFADKVLLLFSKTLPESDFMDHTLRKLSLLPWENRREACILALPLLQQGWQQLNSGPTSVHPHAKSLREFYRGQLYCFQGICAIVNDDVTQPQLVFDYIAKAKDAFERAHRIYSHATSMKAANELDALIRNTLPKKVKVKEEGDSVSHSSLGRQYIQEKKWALAYKHFKRAHKKCPNSPIFKTEKTISHHLKQASELQYLCQTTPIVIRKATQERYREMISENLECAKDLAASACKSLIFEESEARFWEGAIGAFVSRND